MRHLQKGQLQSLQVIVSLLQSWQRFTGELVRLFEVFTDDSTLVTNLLVEASSVVRLLAY